MLRKREEQARKEAEASSREKGLQLQVTRQTVAFVMLFVWFNVYCEHDGAPLLSLVEAVRAGG